MDCREHENGLEDDLSRLAQYRDRDDSSPQEIETCQLVRFIKWHPRHFLMEQNSVRIRNYEEYGIASAGFESSV